MTLTLLGAPAAASEVTANLFPLSTPILVDWTYFVVATEGESLWDDVMIRRTE